MILFKQKIFISTLPWEFKNLYKKKEYFAIIFNSWFITIVHEFSKIYNTDYS